MASAYFDFKKFRVHHDKCAMKVGTDGVLLGAWAQAANARTILDIGTGCGLIALMMAQRFENAQITAIEIDQEAALQAQNNFDNSPFCGRIKSFCVDLRKFPTPPQRFDCVVSNPPFFTESLLPPSERRSLARNTDGLPFECLIDEAKRLMAPHATFHVIIPYQAAHTFLSLCAERSLSLLERLDIQTNLNKPPKRSLLRLINNVTATVPLYKTIPLMGEDHQRSLEYQHLTRDFYL